MTLLSEIEKIKIERNNFLNSFNLNSDINHLLSEASNNRYINSIRIHKYLTSTGLIGKVITARFLESIKLTEKTQISQLTDGNIKDIGIFISQV